jgi:PASTA domain
MGSIQQAMRRALAPMSSQLTRLVHGANRRRRSAAGPAPAWRRRRSGRFRATRSHRLQESRSWSGDAVSSGTVVLPDLVGMSVDGARQLLRSMHLQPMAADPDGPPLTEIGWPDGVVVAQLPDPGTPVPAGSGVRLWVERGPGSAGVREPRRPRPQPHRASGMRDEESGEAVG